MKEIDARHILAGRLRELRRLSGLSQGQVSKHMEMHRPTISEIEAGNRRVNAEELICFAKLYDVSVGYLTGDVRDRLLSDDPLLQLAARELQKLPADSLEKLLEVLVAFRMDNRGAEHTARTDVR